MVFRSQSPGIGTGVYLVQRGEIRLHLGEVSVTAAVLSRIH